MTKLDKAVNGLFHTLKRMDGRTVVYRRANLATTLTAIVDNVDEDEINAGGYSLKHQTKQFAFLKSDFRFGTATIRPQDGDVIEMDGQKYSIVNQDNGRKWNFDDPGETIITVKGTCET